MSRFASIDLSQLPQPAALQAISFEAILDARMADLVARFAAGGVTYDVGALETDPAKVLQEVDSYREILVRARINDAVLATSLAYATGADLDVIAANFKTLRAPGETDASLRLRAQLAWENLSIGGSYGGYEYTARSTAPVEIGDCAVFGHEIDVVPKGEVRIVVLAATAAGIPSSTLLSRITAAFPRANRKVNDRINPVSATVRTYTAEATLVLRSGADPQSVRDAQYQQLLAYTTSRRAIGASVTYGGIAAAMGGGAAASLIDRVEMQQPFAGGLTLDTLPTIGGGPFDVPICTGYKLDYRIAA